MFVVFVVVFIVMEFESENIKNEISNEIEGEIEREVEGEGEKEVNYIEEDFNYIRNNILEPAILTLTTEYICVIIM